ncbi:CoxG family protein [Pseudorhodoplanes sinuspersici]|nr:SRPBCC domain-containing protein [Pseudorhodoplanes sinuspersici]
MSMTLPAAPADVWNTLTEVARVSQCIPGCEDVEEIERLSSYKAIMKQKIGPFKIEVPADIIVESLTEPSHVRTRASGRDKFTGTRLAVVLDVRLMPQEEGGGSTLDLQAEVDVQGRLASLGFGIIKRRADQNFEEFEQRLKTMLEAC